VVIATGNDWRAIEAGAHAYAVKNGKYTSLSTWGKDADGNLVGTLEMPMAVDETRAPSGYDEFRDVKDLARDIAQWDSFRNFVDTAPADILKKLQSIV